MYFIFVVGYNFRGCFLYIEMDVGFSFEVIFRKITMILVALFEISNWVLLVINYF